MKCVQQNNPLAVSLALASVIHSAAGAAQLNFEDGYTHGYLSVGVGSPAAQYSLLIDTASSNTWVGANQPYNPTSTSQDTGSSVSIAYGDGQMSGQEYIDQVTLGDLTVSEQSIGVASKSEGFSGVDGILGLGPTDLTQDTVNGQSTVPTVLDNLFNEGSIGDKVIHIGQQKLTFGGFDETLFVGSVNYVPLTASSPANNYWGVDADFAYGGTPLLQGKSGIIDYMNPTISLPSDAYNALLQATGATFDQATNLPVLDSCDGLQTLDLRLGGRTYQIPPRFYTWPQDQNTAINGQSDKCYLAVDESGGSNGIDFTLGYNTLKNYNIILDAENSQVGIAEAVVGANLGTNLGVNLGVNLGGVNIGINV